MSTSPRNCGTNLYPVTLQADFGPYSMDLDVPEGVWNPTPHGMHLGRMLVDLDFTGEHVLELGTGCGIHALLLAWRGAERLSLTEIEPEILDNARHNVEKHGVETPAEYQVANWIRVSGGPFDCLVTNPPFAKSGKTYRRYFIDTLILETHALVRPGGRLIFVQSSMANIPRSIAQMEECGMAVRVIGETSHTFRPYYFEDPSFLLEMARIPGAYEVRDGTHHERLIVLEGRLPG